MKKNLVEIYALAVCFVTLICFAIFLGTGSYDILEISHPEMTLSSHQYQRHQSNETFTPNWLEKKETLSEAEVTKRREKNFSAVLDSERRDATQSLIRVVIILIIDLAIFFAHWKLGKWARESNSP